ncbi:MAG: hypothetical protein U9R74_12705 [Pseudomonadota bacterium]|nr:hypothetical protein [Pseudomonadota bacterium]
MILQRLNPADHFTLALDHEIRKSGLAGNYCALAMELEGIPDHAEIARHCSGFARQFPLAVARLTRQGRQYAWVPSDNETLPFQVSKLDTTAGDAACRRQRLLDLVNRGAPVSASAPFELHLIESAGRSLLALRWFHPAADAKSAELVLHHLFHVPPRTQYPRQAPADQLLRQWGLWRKFRLARQAVHNIRGLDRHASALPVDTGCAADRLALKLVSFDAAQTERIMAQARRHAGMAGTTLYLIGCMMRAMEAAGATQAGDVYCVPYAVNLRICNALYPVFGNQVSFLLAQAGRDMVRSRGQLFAHLRDQNRSAIRQGRDHAMLPLMQAGSWLSLEKFGRIVRNSPIGRERSSFWFSYTGDMAPEPAVIAGCPVRGMYQVSQVTTPPGLGLLVSSFQGRLVLSYNYIDNQFQVDWIERLTQAMTAELLDLDEKLL